MKNLNIVEDYFQNVIKKSWTWEKLTQEERQRFIDMDVFDKIKGRDQTRIEWLNTVYQSFLAALDFVPIGWRETEENTPEF